MDKLDQIALHILGSLIVRNGTHDVLESIKESYKAAKLMIDYKEEKLKKIVDIQQIEHVSIKDLGLSIRTSNTLLIADIKTVKDLCGKTKWELMGLPNLGAKSMKEIIDTLGIYGLSLKDA